MTRRIELEWPAGAPFEGRDGRPLRLLAASDEPDPALEHPVNRAALGPIDLVIGCGDLGPDRLAFLGDAFRAPVVFVRGNHDRGGAWRGAGGVPEETVGLDRSLAGLPLLGLGWPTSVRDPARHDERGAWGQVARASLARLGARRGPWLVFSHVPPRGTGDVPSDPYHAGFAAYRFLLDRLRPPLWLHGHTPLAAAAGWHTPHGPTTLVNVSGSVLIELRPSGAAPA